MAKADVVSRISGIDSFSSVMKGTIKTLDKLKNKADQVGKSFTTKLTLPIIATATAATFAAVKLNTEMGNVSTLISGDLEQSTKRTKELKVGVQEAAIEFGKSTNEMAKGVFQVVSAFGDSDESMEKFRINAKAAVAGVSEVSDAIALTSSVTKAYGDITLETTGKVTDLAFKANELGQTSFPEMARSLPAVTSLSSTLGLKMEEMFNVMATGTGVTGNTSEVSTQLGAILGELLKPSTNLQIAFKKLGVDSGKTLIQQKGLHGSLVALKDVSQEYGKELVDLFGSQEAIKLSLALTGKSSDKFVENLKKMQNATGATSAAFEKQTKGINKTGFEINRTISRITVLAERIGDKLLPIIDKFANNYILPLLTKLESLNEDQLEWIIILGSIAAAIGPVLIGVGMFSGLISSGIVVFLKFAAAIKIVGSALMFLVANPIGLTITAIAVLVVGIFMLIKHWETVKETVLSVWNSVSESTRTKIGVLLMIFNPFLGVLMLIINHFDQIKAAAIGLAQIILPQWMEEKLGISGGELPAPERPNVAQTITAQLAEKRAIQSEFSGTLHINNVPPKSRFQGGGGGLNVELDTGIIPVGVAP